MPKGPRKIWRALHSPVWNSIIRFIIEQHDSNHWASYYQDLVTIQIYSSGIIWIINFPNWPLEFGSQPTYKCNRNPTASQWRPICWVAATRLEWGVRNGDRMVAVGRQASSVILWKGTYMSLFVVPRMTTSRLGRSDLVVVGCLEWRLVVWAAVTFWESGA